MSQRAHSLGSAVATAVIACATGLGCSQAAPERGSAVPAASQARTLTIIGTNDLHGALDRLPLFAGFVANVRAARAADGGAVLLLDAGDMFQGTLESNLAEGADVVRAYNQLGYAAAAVGNHEFDYGPVGPQATAQSSGDDPQGALKARISEAAFPFLVTNVLDARTGRRIAWKNAPASIILELAGFKVGVLGASTDHTPETTMAANFSGLKMGRPTARFVAAEAKALRDRGVDVVVLIAHLGSSCKRFFNPDDATSCDRGDEAFSLLRDVPSGLIDVVVAGHTHAAVAHRIHGAAVIESYSSGRAFGRVDVKVADRRVVAVEIHKPYVMCPLDARKNPAPVATCHPPDYEGRAVAADPKIQTIVDAAASRAQAIHSEKLGVTIATPITKSYGTESSQGNWLADLMLAAYPTAHVAMTNGGGLRADIPAGELTYGRLYAAMPFDNRFALLRVEGRHLRQLIAANLQHRRGILSWSGLTAKARCRDAELELQIEVRGEPLDDNRTYTVVTSDFLVSRDDGLIRPLQLPDGATALTDVTIRDGIAAVLRGMAGRRIAIQPAPRGAARRLDYPGKRPVRCSRATPRAEED
jgi:5'-nucleotidase